MRFDDFYFAHRQLDIEPDIELDIQVCKKAFSGETSSRAAQAANLVSPQNIFGANANVVAGTKPRSRIYGANRVASTKSAEGIRC